MIYHKLSTGKNWDTQSDYSICMKHSIALLFHYAVRCSKDAAKIAVSVCADQTESELGLNNLLRPVCVMHIYVFLCPQRNFRRHIKITPSVRPSVRYKLCLSHNSETTEINLMKLHRKVKHNEKVCPEQGLDSYTQDQGHNRVRGQICVSAITLKLLMQI